MQGTLPLAMLPVAVPRVARQGEAWWRRRELNPRPETFNTGVYMLILNFGFLHVTTVQAKELHG